MKYLKMLGLAAIAAAALMAFVGASTASATELTCGSAMCAAETTIESSAETASPNGPVTLHPLIGDIECSTSSVAGKTLSTGSASTTVEGPISALSFSNCNATVDVISKGSLIVHTRSASSNNNGTLTSAGAEVTVELAGFHCIAGTNTGTDIGTVTGSATTSGTATLDIEATIPISSGGFFCGSSAQWTGHYKVSNPDSLNID